MKTRITLLIGVGLLLAGLGLEAVKQVKAQGGGGFGSLPWGFVVVDSRGKPVGPVIGNNTASLADYNSAGEYISGATVVALPYHGKELPVTVSRDLLQASTLLFASTDCTGQAYALVYGPFLATAMGSDAITLYVENGASETVTVESAEVYSSPSCSLIIPKTQNVVPVEPAVNLSEFKPPFSVVSRSLIP